jgi:MFS family permease
VTISSQTDAFPLSSGHPHTAPSGTPILDSGGSWYVLGLVTFAYALAYVDRQVLNLVVDPIKQSLLLSDTQFSYLQGAAFIIAYLIGAPIFGRLVDIGSRRAILIFGVCMWSACTILCGLSETYWQLAAARFGVGISEACVFPVALSLIPELFSTQKAPRALSIFTLGGQIGGGFSLVAGGAVIALAATIATTIPLLSNLASWQMAFVLVGLPGFAFALLLRTMKEPRRFERTGTDAPTRWSYGQSISAIWARRSFYLRIFLFTGMNGIVFLGVPAWYPTFLIRVHHMPVAQVGVTVGTITLIFGATGALLGPVVAEFFRKRGYEDAPLRAAACAAVGSFLCCLAIPLTTNSTAALAVIGGTTFFCGFPTGIIAFAMQRATPIHIRGVVASIYTLFAQIIGYGIGPTAIALTTDHVFHDPLKVGNAMQLICGGAAICVGLVLVTNFGNYRRSLQDPWLNPGHDAGSAITAE